MVKKERITPKKKDKPMDYQLVSLFIKRKLKEGPVIEKKMNGWWDGKEWFSLRLWPDDTILGWEYLRPYHG
jgi:hypothetical protein